MMSTLFIIAVLLVLIVNEMALIGAMVLWNGMISPTTSNNVVLNPLHTSSITPGIPSSPVIQPEEQGLQNAACCGGLTTNITLPDIVRDFAAHLLQKIYADERVKNAFAIRRLSADKAANILFRLSVENQKKLGSLDPEGNAQRILEAVKQNFDKVTTDSFIALHGYNNGLLLFSQGILNPNNVSYYAQNNFDKIKNRVYSVVSATPETDLEAVTNGYTDFVFENGFLKAGNAFMGPMLYANEWYSL